MRKILLTMMALIAGTTLSFADDSYELVTSESSLAAGDEVLIVFVSGSTYYVPTPAFPVSLSEEVRVLGLSIQIPILLVTWLNLERQVTAH